MKTDRESVKAELQKRLRRIEGQVRGVQKMLDEERQCHEVLQQLAAVRAAVQSATLLVVRHYVTDCLVNLDAGDHSGREVLVNDLISLLGKAP